METLFTKPLKVTLFFLVFAYNVRYEGLVALEVEFMGIKALT